MPSLVALASGDGATGWTLAPAALVALLLSYASFRLPPPRDASEAEDAVAVTLAFPLAVLFSSAPYLTHELGLLDALFEGMSGVTATGLSRYGGIDEQPFGIHFLRAWQEWIGGYVIITLTVALLSKRAKGPQEMAEPDVADDAGAEGEQKANPTTRARWVTLAYVVLTVLCVLAVWASGQGFGFSVLHGLTAISTGGFATRSDSLGSVAPVAVWTLMAFSLLGAAALSDYVRPFSRGEGLKKLLLILAAMAGLSIFWGGMIMIAEDGAVSAYEALQVAASAQTTTGFSVPNVGLFTDASKLLLTASMWIGGDVGSTAGGLKIMRLFAVALIVYAAFQPRADTPDTPGKEPRDILQLAAWWLAFSVVGVVALLLAGHPLTDSVFEWSSALNNTGLSVGVSSSPEVPVPTRIALILAMWLGRVEILFAVLVFKLVGWPPSARQAS